MARWFGNRRSDEVRRAIRERPFAILAHLGVTIVILVLSVAGMAWLSLNGNRWGLSPEWRLFLGLVVLIVPTWCCMLFSEHELRPEVRRAEAIPFIGCLTVAVGVMAHFAMRSLLTTLLAALAAAVFGILMAALCSAVVRRRRHRTPQR